MRNFATMLNARFHHPMPHSSISLKQLLDRARGRFVVPAYQRRYVWGRECPGEKDTAAFLTACLTEACRRGEPYFLQGITVAFGPDGCVLVDGQQRLTYLRLLLDRLGWRGEFAIAYECREQAERWLAGDRPADSPQTIDIHYFIKTLDTIGRLLGPEVDADYILNEVRFLCIELDDPAHGAETFAMMNGAKQPMLAPDIIKADIMRLAASDPGARESAEALRARYAAEWESWARWWNSPDVRLYFSPLAGEPLDLLLRLCARGPECGLEPLTYNEFHLIVDNPAEAKRFFSRLRHAQKRFEEVYADPVAYNRAKAVLLLQDVPEQLLFLHALCVEASIDAAELQRYYKLSFLAMSVTEIARGDSAAARFDDLLATLSMADIYHSEAKPLAMRLLLRLNLDEDIKLGRKFDFSAWSGRSLEHIFSKSKVWHLGPNGKPLDGNDNPIHTPIHKLERDPSMLRRDDIKNADGAQLSEHCIGNLVLLYGRNNAEFGNATFERKKQMFLTPSADQAFQSRNLLHSVCVFARDNWTAQSIVDNYNLTLKNLKIYYGYK